MIIQSVASWELEYSALDILDYFYPFHNTAIHIYSSVKRLIILFLTWSITLLDTFLILSNTQSCLSHLLTVTTHCVFSLIELRNCLRWVAILRILDLTIIRLQILNTLLNLPDRAGCQAPKFRALSCELIQLEHSLTCNLGRSIGH